MARVWPNASLSEVTTVSPQAGLGVCDITDSFASDTDSIISLWKSRKLYAQIFSSDF